MVFSLSPTREGRSISSKKLPLPVPRSLYCRLLWKSPCFAKQAPLSSPKTYYQVVGKSPTSVSREAEPKDLWRVYWASLPQFVGGISICCYLKVFCNVLHSVVLFEPLLLKWFFSVSRLFCCTFTVLSLPSMTAKTGGAGSLQLVLHWDGDSYPSPHHTAKWEAAMDSSLDCSPSSRV